MDARYASSRRSKPPSGKLAVSKELSSTDQVVEHIAGSILSGRFVPGQWLVEGGITKSLNLSRGPVREAFRRLDALGILSCTMYRGACVRMLSRAEAIDLMVAAEGIDRMTARLAADAVRAAKNGRRISALKRALRPYRDREFELASTPQLRQQFYDILIALTGNSQLPFLFPTMRIHLLRLQTQMYRDYDSSRVDIEDFAAVARAVLEGDGRAAEKASCAHHRRIQHALSRMPAEAFAPEVGGGGTRPAPDLSGNR